MKILILTGRFGMGHYSVSNSLRQQIEEQASGTQINIVDLIEYASPHCASAVYHSFELMVKHASRMYNRYYKATQAKAAANSPAFSHFFSYKLRELILQAEPDLIISTLPFCSQVASCCLKRYNITIPLVTCMTDIACHSDWIADRTSCYLVGSSSLKAELICRGIEPERIFICGVPVGSPFRKINTNVPKPSYAKKELLIMGGGLGLLPEMKEFYQALNDIPDVKTTVIAANNHHLYNLLQGKYENIEVVGFTTEVYRYMQNADLIVTKAGGITLFEAIYSNTPILFFKPFLEQEQPNADYIIKNRIGKALPTLQGEWVSCIAETLKNNEQQAMQKNLNAIKQELDSSALHRILLDVQREIKGEDVCFTPSYQPA